MTQVMRLLTPAARGCAAGNGTVVPSSTPSRVPTAPLSGGQALHATRYLADNDSDGMRRMIEVDTTGAPAAAEVLKLPTTPHPMPEPPAPLSFVPSHPTTRNMDTWGK